MGVDRGFQLVDPCQIELGFDIRLRALEDQGVGTWLTLAVEDQLIQDGLALKALTGVALRGPAVGCKARLQLAEALGDAAWQQIARCRGWTRSDAAGGLAVDPCHRRR